MGKRSRTAKHSRPAAKKPQKRKPAVSPAAPAPLQLSLPLDPPSASSLPPPPLPSPPAPAAISRRSFLGLTFAGLAAAPTAQSPHAGFPPIPEVRMILGGDVMLSRFVGKLARQKQDPAWPFQEIAAFFTEFDLAFVNLESPFCDRPGLVEKGMVFKAEPEMIEGLLLAGVDIVSTANNHARDRGDYGVGFTLDWLAQHGIAAAGTAKSAETIRQGAMLERNGLRIGFLGYTYDQRNGNHASDDPRVAGLDVESMKLDVAGLRQRSDIVVVSMHAGEEYAPQPHPSQVEFARAAIDAGALLVAGHHPHVVQPPEFYQAGLILYSLGNLVFDQFHREDTQRSWLAEVRMRPGQIVDLRIHPIAIDRTQPRLSGQSWELSQAQSRPNQA